MTVSYTHLDVYKRQGHDESIACAETKRHQYDWRQLSRTDNTGRVPDRYSSRNDFQKGKYRIDFTLGNAHL